MAPLARRSPKSAAVRRGLIHDRLLNARRCAGIDEYRGTAQCKAMRTLLPAMLLFLLPMTAVADDMASVADADSRQHRAERESVAAECRKIGHKLGSVSIGDCERAKLKASGAYSVRGQPILLREYPPRPGRKPQARVLLVGGIHGDEYSSVSIVFKWMQKLDRYHSGLFHWRIAPLVNPDGLLRKKSSRLNANGVDLNRNFPTPDWKNQTRDYWVRRTHRDPRRYPGKAALSEPESRWLYEEIRTFRPHVIITVHAPYGILDFDGPPKAPGKMGYLHLHLLGTYPGSLGNCAGVQHRIPVITMELPYAGIMPRRGEINRMWRDMVRWLRRNIPRKGTREAYAAFDSIDRSLRIGDKGSKRAGG